LAAPVVVVRSASVSETMKLSWRLGVHAVIFWHKFGIANSLYPQWFSVRGRAVLELSYVGLMAFKNVMDARVKLF